MVSPAVSLEPFFHFYPRLSVDLRLQVIRAALQCAPQSVPFEVRCSQDGLAAVATVDPEWQEETETLTFQQIQVCVDDLTVFELLCTGRRTRFVKVLSLLIDLDRGTLRHSPAATAISAAFVRMFTILKSWDREELDEHNQLAFAWTLRDKRDRSKHSPGYFTNIHCDFSSLPVVPVIGALWQGTRNERLEDLQRYAVIWRRFGAHGWRCGAPSGHGDDARVAHTKASQSRCHSRAGCLFGCTC